MINEGDSSWKGDGIEFYFDGDYSHDESYDGVDDEHARITVDDVDLSGVQSEHDIDGTAFKVLLTDTGYNVEVAFPLAKLNIKPSVDPEPIYGPEGEMIPGSDIARNNIIGFELQINDNDEDAGAEAKRSHQVRWYSEDNNSWQNPSLFGQARLTGTTE